MTRITGQDDDSSQYWRLVQRLERLEQGGFSKNPLPFATGWSNYGDTFGVYEGCSYSRYSRLVVLQGLALSAAGTAGNSIVGTLPLEFRPSAQNIFIVITSAGAGRLDVLANGQVYLYPAVGANGWVALSGLSFMT